MSCINTVRRFIEDRLEDFSMKWMEIMGAKASSHIAPEVGRELFSLKIELVAGAIRQAAIAPTVRLRTFFYSRLAVLTRVRAHCPNGRWAAKPAGE